MNYQKIYNNLIESRKKLNRSKRDSYFENHHIIPKCLNGSNDKDNLILLTAREHFIAHWLLIKIAKNKNEKIKLELSFRCFLWDKDKKRKLTARQFELIRLCTNGTLSERLKGNKYALGTKRTEETKKKMSENNGMKNSITRKKVSDALKGIKRLEETKKQIS